MTKQFTFISILLSALILPQLAHAEIYKTVDSEGRVTYSNVKIKGAKKLDLEPADTVLELVQARVIAQKNLRHKRVQPRQQTFLR